MSAKENKWLQDSVNEEKKIKEIGERVTNLWEEEEEVTVDLKWQPTRLHIVITQKIILIHNLTTSITT